MVNLKESRRRTDGPSAHTNRRRVAIAVFDTAQAIRRAIAGLEAIGILLACSIDGVQLHDLAMCA